MRSCSTFTGSGCNGGGCDGGENCCWARARAAKKFKKFVLKKYIFEVIFDVVVSVFSVVTDLVSIGLYIQKGRWLLSVITAIPVLLPTIVFTNVYLADETQGYCKLPKRKGKVPEPSSRTVSESDDKESTSAPSTSSTVTIKAPLNTETPLEQFHSKMDFHCGTCHMLCSTCCGCWGGILRSICYKDESIRDDGMAMVRKSIKRLLKYLFGTFVLRYISLAWYAKAFMFGIRAYKEPKKYMRMALPTTHWSYDLLVKLDFLQAALENAPQCIVQLYVLLVYPDENIVLGMLTLLFSFMDFVRVSISVQWDILKGPVIAPSGCYKSLMWKLINISSWIFLYIGRSAALALSIATAHGWSTAIPVVILVFHLGLFTKLFSKAKYGVAAQKLFVSVFISVFFLPEFDMIELPILTQFYYAVVHVENLFLIVPWNGMDYDYCNTIRLGGVVKPNPRYVYNPTEQFQSWNSSDFRALQPEKVDSSCLINPTIFVIAVPALTMIGIVARLASSKKMFDFKKTIPPRDDAYVMEERIASIYSKKWTSIGFDALYKAFLNMLKNDVIKSDGEESGKKTEKSAKQKPVFVISPSFNKEFQASQKFIRAVSSFSSEPGDGENFLQDVNMKTKRSMSVDAYGLTYRGKVMENSKESDDKDRHYLGVEMPKRSKSQDDICYEERRNKINLMQDVDIQFIKVEGPDGPHFMEMTWI